MKLLRAFASLLLAVTMLSMETAGQGPPLYPAPAPVAPAAPPAPAAPAPGVVVGQPAAGPAIVGQATSPVGVGIPTLGIGERFQVGNPINIQLYRGYPVFWGPFGPWGACTGTCGIGYRRRQRRCYATVTAYAGQRTVINPGVPHYHAITNRFPQAQLGQNNFAAINSIQTVGIPAPAPLPVSYARGTQGCTGTLVQAEGCDTLRPCVVIGYWSQWGPWSLCSASCNGGQQERIRQCSGGTGCGGQGVEYRGCNAIQCVGVWLAWTPYSACTLPCGGGKQTRTRVCSGTGACQGGVPSMTISCNVQPCAKYAWGVWRPFGPCSVNCGQGTYSRTRPCMYGNQISPNNQECLKLGGFASETKACSQGPCAGWGIWGPWSGCPPCGVGENSRTRLCMRGQAPAQSPAACAAQGGVAYEKKACLGLPSCNNWGVWGPWSVCPPCGVGESQRTRYCMAGSNQAPGPAACLAQGGVGLEKQPCLGLQPCHNWGVWGPWSGCPQCGFGNNRRTRLCMAGSGPARGPLPCERQGGHGVEVNPCIDLPSCAAWSNWGPWLGCRPGCGPGKNRKVRRCLNNGVPLLSNAECVQQGGGPYYDENCNLGSCYSWSVWGPWAICSKPCGRGETSRSRTCLEDGVLTGDTSKCYRPGPGQLGATHKQPCFGPPCFEWRPWGPYGPCTPACGQGTKTRIRICTANGRNTRPSDCSSLDGGHPRQDMKCDGPPCYSYNQWTQWSTICSVTCGPGNYVRTRACQKGGVLTDPSHCAKFGIRYEERPCPVVSCIGIWSKWTSYTPCPVTCGIGQQRRTRTCSNNNCIGDSFHIKQCDPGPCITYLYGNWGQWQECSVTCGNGDQFRSRPCVDNFGKRAENSFCPGEEFFERRPCYAGDCLGVWSPWGGYSPCSEKCGPGTQFKSRTCSKKYCGNDKSVEVRNCNLGPCITYLWGKWQKWQACSATCGQGDQIRIRPCLDSLGNTAGGYDMCGQGDYIMSRSCNLGPCYGRWSEYGQWMACSVPCGGGTQYRRRTCSKLPCIGDDTESRICNTQLCITYALTSWSSWASCSKSCGGGTTTRSRSCGSSLGGTVDNSLCNAAFNDFFESRTCNEVSCYDFGQWGAWSPCSSFCGRGKQRKTRECVDGRGNRGPRVACSTDDNDFLQEIVCIKPDCPGEYLPWGEWTLCSAPCNSGTRERRRTCSTNKCPEDTTKEIQVCNKQACRLPDEEGFYSAWSRWSACDKECGGFSRQTRTCTGTCKEEFERIRTCTNCGDGGDFSQGSCAVSPLTRVNCGYPGINPNACVAQGCCYDDSLPNTKWCYYQLGSTQYQRGGGGGGGGGASVSSSGSIFIVTSGGQTTVRQTGTGIDGKTVVTTSTSESGIEGALDELYGPASEPQACPPCWDSNVPEKPYLARYRFCLVENGCPTPFIEEKIGECDIERCPESIQLRSGEEDGEE